MSSKPPVPATIDAWVAHAAAQLNTYDVPSSRLDAELIVAFCLNKDRSWVIAHGNEHFESHSRQLADSLLKKRLSHIPLAYLFGTKEFYRRDFFVTKDVLIPRPETETLIDLLLELTLPKSAIIHDVGTGSGCLAITAKLELPSATVTGSDTSPEALEIARRNASHLGADVKFRVAHLMDNSYEEGGVSALLANLPYVDPTWKRSRSTDHEPKLALFANDSGLALINELIAQAPSHLAEGGYMLLEADPAQHERIIKTGALHGLRHIRSQDYIVVLQR